MAKKKAKKKRLTPEQLDANYKEFIKGKDIVDNGKEQFIKVLKKAVIAPKQPK